MFSDLINQFNSIPPAFWAVLGSAVVASGILEIVKKTLIKDVSGLSDKTQIGFSTALAFGVTGVQFLLSPGSIPAGLLGTHTVAVMAFMQLFYTYALKPLSSAWSALLADARAYRLQQNPPAPAVESTAPNSPTLAG